MTIDEVETEDADDTETKDSLRADLEAAFNDIETSAADGSEDRESSTPPTESPENPEAQPEKEVAAKEQDSTDKLRNSEAKASDSQTPEKSEGTEAPVLAPLSWSSAEKEIFAKLPRDLQKAVVEREHQRDSFIQRKSQELSATLRDFSEVLPAIDAEHQRLLAQGANVTKGQFLDLLIKAHHTILNDPATAIRNLAESHGVDLSQLTEAAPLDPRVKQLADQVRYYESQFQGIQQQQQQQQDQYLGGVVENFKSARNDKGEPLFPYAADPNFEAQMAVEVSLLRNQNPYAEPAELLKHAYETTVWKIPELRAEEIKKQQGIAEARRISEEKKKVQQARKMAASITGAPNGTVQVKSGGSLRDDLLAAADSIGW